MKIKNQLFITAMMSGWLFVSGLGACKSVQPAVPEKKEIPKPFETVSIPVEPVKETGSVNKRYRETLKLGLVMPFYFESNFPESLPFDSVEIDPRSIPALQFYEGMMLAADSLRKTGLELIIHVMDNSVDSISYHWMLMNYTWLKKNDLNYLQLAPG